MAAEFDNEMNPVVGIDLGTCNSCLARWDGRGVRVETDRLSGLPTIPSVVYFDEKTKWLAGTQALRRGHAVPENAVFYIKRKMDDPDFRVTLAGRDYSPVDISAEILRAVAARAFLDRYPESAGAEIAGAVITVPYYFTSLQRNNTEQAGERADLNVLSLVNEPTAASIAYAFDGQAGIFKDEPQKVMVFDLGGGTFDITVFEVTDTPEKYEFRVLSTGGDHHLGGTDIDEQLMKLAAQHYKNEHGIDLFTHEPEKDRLRLLSELRQAVMTAKHDLACMPEATVIVANLPGGTFIEMGMSQEDLKGQSQPWIDRIVSITEDTMERAKVDRPNALNRVVLVGGSTRLPFVAPILKEITGQEPFIDPQVDTTVARGAAFYAAFAAKPCRWAGMKEIEIIDVNSQALGVATSDGRFEVLIGADVPLPKQSMKQFTLSEDNATDFEVEVYQGSNLRDVTKNELIGTIPVRDIPPRAKSDVNIDILFRLDKNNICTVKVTVTGPDFDPIVIEKGLHQ